MKLISIIVPVYNMEKILVRCLESIKKQTYENLEILLVDDGSKDSSAEICKKYCEADPRFKYIYRENGGNAAACNTGVKNATGDYIGFCDSDDWLEPYYVADLANALENEKCNIAIGGYKTSDGENITKITEPKEAGVISRRELSENFWEYFDACLINNVWNKLYRREVITTLMEEKMRCGQDLYFNMFNMRNAERFVFVQTTGYFYYKPVLDHIKYPKNNAWQCLTFSDCVRGFLAQNLPEEEYVKKYEAFLCCNMCRDVCTLALGNSFSDAKKMIEEFLTYPEFTNALKHKAWKGKGKKYEIVGKMLGMGMVTPLILAAKAIKL